MIQNNSSARATSFCHLRVSHAKWFTEDCYFESVSRSTSNKILKDGRSPSYNCSVSVGPVQVQQSTEHRKTSGWEDYKHTKALWLLLLQRFDRLHNCYALIAAFTLRSHFTLTSNTYRMKKKKSTYWYHSSIMRTRTVVIERNLPETLPLFPSIANSIIRRGMRRW